jgi:hypothetical protein
VLLAKLCELFGAGHHATLSARRAVPGRLQPLPNPRLQRSATRG